MKLPELKAKQLRSFPVSVVICVILFAMCLGCRFQTDIFSALVLYGTVGSQCHLLSGGFAV